jgi:hypothetical protein
MSRSIVIKMRRMAPNQKREEILPDQLEHLEPLRRQIARWAKDNTEALKERNKPGSRPALPETLTGRRANNWRVLAAIADVAGRCWPERVRDIAKLLSAKPEETLNVQAIEDIFKMFAARPNATYLSSKDVVDGLVAQEDRPWAEHGRTGKPLTQNGLARLLKGFEIYPANVRTPSGTVVKAYTRQAFEETFRQYIPAPEGAQQPLQPLQD